MHSCICERDRTQRTESYFPSDCEGRICIYNHGPGVPDLVTETDSKHRKSAQLLVSHKGRGLMGGGHLILCVVVRRAKLLKQVIIKGCDGITVVS